MSEDLGVESALYSKDDKTRSQDGFNIGGDHPPIVENGDEAVVLLPNDDPRDDRSAPERISALFEGMPGRRNVLLAILNACRESCSEEDIVRVVSAAQQENRSVFDAFALCRMLEGAGALDHVRENGDPFDEPSLTPVYFEEGGVEYLQAREAPTSFWSATASGMDYLESDDPRQRMLDLFEAENVYAPIYRFILESCLEGATTASLAATVDDHPLTQKPRLYVQHFVKKLEDAGALEWIGVWKANEEGAMGIALLKGAEEL